jgi:hypothetical protein
MVDDETDEEELEEEAEDDWGDREFVSDVSGDEDDILSDLEDVEVHPHKRPKKKAMSECSYLSSFSYSRFHSESASRGRI